MNEAAVPIRIALIEDNEDDCLAFHRAFKKNNILCKIIDYTSANKALQEIRSNPSLFDIIVTDHGLPDMSGLDFCKRVLAEKIDLPIVFLTGSGSEKVAVEALKNGVNDYIVKDPGRGYIKLLPISIQEVLKKYNDRIARKRAELALHKSEERYRKLFESTQEGIITIGHNGKILSANPACVKMLGYNNTEELTGRDVSTLLASPDLWESLLRELNEKRYIKNYEIDMKNKYHAKTINTLFSATIQTDSDGKIQRVEGMFTDITKRKIMENDLRELNRSLEYRVNEEIENRRQNEQMLIQQSKMAAMGEMIGAIAHQWRQPLNALGIIVQDISDAYEFGELDKKYLDETVKKSLNQIEFMSKTIDDFRNFYRTSKNKEDFNIIEAINSVITLQGAQLKHNYIDIIIKSGESKDLIITGYPNEFKQVILNIISNARSAILEAREERLLEEDSGDILIKHFKKKGSAVVSISNSGKNIPKEIIERIFEPYFTTKKPSEGTGIGLYMSKTIIEKNMGGMFYVNNIKNGVTFTIELPGAR